MPAIVELTPLTQRGRELINELEAKTGLLAFKTSDASGAKTYTCRRRPMSTDFRPGSTASSRTGSRI